MTRKIWVSDLILSKTTFQSKLNIRTRHYTTKIIVIFFRIYQRKKKSQEYIEYIVLGFLVCQICNLRTRFKKSVNMSVL